MRTVFPSHFSSLIKPSSLNGRREKKEILIPLLVQRKWEKEYRLFHLSLSLSSLRNYSEPFPPLEKYTQCRNTGTSSCASCCRSLFTRELPFSAGSLASAVASLQSPRVQRHRFRRHTCLFSRCSHELFFHAT